MMKPLSLLRLVCLPLFFFSLLANLSASPEAGDKKSPALLNIMQRELQRAKADLGKLDPAPYFISYSAKDQVVAVAVASEGSLVNSTQAHTRTADVIIRVGSPALDNTHGASRHTALRSNLLPLDDDPDAIAHVLWQLTYSGYRTAASAYLNVKTKNQVDAKEEDVSADFSLEKPTTSIEASREFAPADDKKLQEAARLYSAAFRKYPYVYHSMVMATSQNVLSYFVTTEGSRSFPAGAGEYCDRGANPRADGIELMRMETFQADTIGGLPNEPRWRAAQKRWRPIWTSCATRRLPNPTGPGTLSARRPPYSSMKCSAIGLRASGSAASRKARPLPNASTSRYCRRFSANQRSHATQARTELN